MSKEHESIIHKALFRMVDDGLIIMGISDNGEFMFELTPKGREKMHKESDE